VIKPTVGIVDLLARTTEGIANTPGFFHERKTTEVRPPRHFDRDQTIFTYDREKANGQKIMCTLEDGIYRKHIYQFHCSLSKSRLILVTNKVVSCLKTPIVKSSHSSEWVVKWSFPITRLQQPVRVDDTTFILVALDESWSVVEKVIDGESTETVKELYDYLYDLPKPNIDFEDLNRPRDGADAAAQFELLTHKETFEGSLKRLITEGLHKGSWKHYYCHVTNGVFSFNPIDNLEKQKTVTLPSSFCISCDGENDKEDAFSLVSKPGEAFYFQADSSWMCQVWVDVCVANGAHTT
jgi:hypothetical protein